MVQRPVDRHRAGIAPGVDAVIGPGLARGRRAPQGTIAAQPPDEGIDIQLRPAKRGLGDHEAGADAGEPPRMVDQVVAGAADAIFGQAEIEQVGADRAPARPRPDAVQDEPDRVVVARRNHQVGTVGEFLPPVPRTDRHARHIGSRIDKGLLDDQVVLQRRNPVAQLETRQAAMRQFAIDAEMLTQMQVGTPDQTVDVLTLCTGIVQIRIGRVVHAQPGLAAERQIDFAIASDRQILQPVDWVVALGGIAILRPILRPARQIIAVGRRPITGRGIGIGGGDRRGRGAGRPLRLDRIGTRVDRAIRLLGKRGTGSRRCQQGERAGSTREHGVGHGVIPVT